MAKVFRNVQQSAKNFAQKVDGHLTNAANSVSSATSNFAGSVMSDTSSHSLRAPELLEGPSFNAFVTDPSFALDHTAVPRPTESVAISVPTDSQSGTPHSSTSNEVLQPAGFLDAAWWKRPGCDYMCITVWGARNLPTMDFESKSSNACVKLAIGTRGATTYYEESTRVCTRNRHPMWQQSFFFPMAKLTAETPVCLSVCHISALVKREDLVGQVATSVGHLLDNVVHPMDPFTSWYRVQGKKPSDKAGDLQLSVTIMSKGVHSKAYPLAREPFNRDTLHSRHSAHTLKIKLHGLKDLKLDGKEFSNATSNMSIDFKVDCCVVSHKLAPTDIGSEITTSANVDSLSFSLDEQVLIPLLGCFGGKATKKQHQEAADIKMYLKIGKLIVARTQVPLWDVPICEGNPDGAEPLAEDTLDPLGRFSTLIPAINKEEESSPKSGSVGGSRPSFMNFINPTQPSEVGSALASPPERLSRTSMGLPRSMPISSDSYRRENVEPVSLNKLLPKLSALVGEDGRKYRRKMDNIGNYLSGFPELEISMQVVPKMDTTEAADQMTVADDDGEDETPIDPITPPAPLVNVSVEMLIPGRPMVVFAALTDADSAYLKEVMGKEALREISIPAWEPAPAVGANAQSRKVTYIRPLNIPMAPKQCNVEEVHTVSVKEGGGFVMERKVTTNAPKGDAFFVLIQDVGVYDPASKSTRFSSSFKIEIVKPLGLLKSIVESGAKSATKAGSTMWAQELAKHMSSRVGAGGGRSVGGAGAAAGGPMAGSGQTMGAPSAGGGFSLPGLPDLATVEHILKMCAYLFITLGVLHMCAGFQHMCRGLGRLLVVIAERD